MAWNAPGGGDKEPPKGDGNPWARRRTPSGGGGAGGGGGGPDFEEFWRKLRDSFRGGGGGGGQSLAGVGLLLGGALFLWLVSGFYQVDDAEEAVVLTFGKYSQTTKAGWHWRVPFPVQRVIKVNVHKARNVTDRATMLTGDGNIVDLEMAIQYKLKSPNDFVFKVREPEDTLAQALRSALREVVGKEFMDDIFGKKRAEIQVRTRELLQAILDFYHTGIEVTNINLKEAKYPDPVQEAFADVLRAQSDKERLKNEAETYRNDILPKAEGAAAREIAGAEAYRDRVIAEAQGKAARFSLLLAEYEQAPQVTRKRMYLDAMQSVFSRSGKILVDGDAGNQMLYLPLDQLLKRPLESVAPGSSATQSPPRTGTPPANPLYDDARGRGRN